MTYNRTPLRLMIDRILRPFQRFAHLEASGGILLLICTVVALVWANSPWSSTYFSLWQTKLTVGIGDASLSKALLLWVNDGLMAVFFFVVGLEIKRELLAGELASVRKAALPGAAAVGGMLVPAGIYVALNAGRDGVAGWGIPMATDIAFALGILALLGSRAPLALKVFLTALAIVDDIGAVLVIALFYTAEISWTSLAAGAGFLAVLIAANWLGVRRPSVYALLGVGLWFAILQSGVHATVAGVLLALTIPFQPRLNAGEFLDWGHRLLEHFDAAGEREDTIVRNEERQTVLHELERAAQEVETPLQRLEHTLHPWVAFFIMPVFALANAGVALSGDLTAAVTHPVSLGVIAGLVVGKQAGVTLFAWLAVRTGMAALPEGITWRQVYGAGWLAGIGFTMSLFIASLAFGGSPLVDMAKVGILAASLIAGVAGWTLLRASSPPRTEAVPPRTEPSASRVAPSEG